MFQLAYSVSLTFRLSLNLYTHTRVREPMLNIGQKKQSSYVKVSENGLFSPLVICLAFPIQLTFQHRSSKFSNTTPIRFFWYNFQSDWLIKSTLLTSSDLKNHTKHFVSLATYWYAKLTKQSFCSPFSTSHIQKKMRDLPLKVHFQITLKNKARGTMPKILKKSQKK